MGYEGTAAKIYFKVLGKLIDEQFAFEGRSRRPPMDPFNSLISLGYSIILNELYGINIKEFMLDILKKWDRPSITKKHIIK